MSSTSHVLQKSTRSKRETRVAIYYWIVAISTLLLVALVNLPSLSRSPTVWQDEVMQIDPAVNLATGLGWCSRAWPSQSSTEFWAANNPLYPALLAAWIRLFGVSVLAVRSFNLLQFAVVSIVLLRIANILGLLRSRSSGAIFIVALWCGGLMSFIYRCGRADVTTMLVCSLVILSYLYARAESNFKPLFVVSCFIIAAGIQSLPYFAALLVADILVTRRFSKGILIGGLGLIAGGVGLAGFMYSQGVLKQFISNTFASNYSLFGVILQAIVIHDQKSQQRFHSAISDLSPTNILRYMSADGMLTACLCVLLFLLVVGILKGQIRLQSPVAVGLGMALLIPIFMTMAGRYADYYLWMSVAPLVLCTVSSLTDLNWPTWVRNVSAVVLVAGVLEGLPRELYVIFKDATSSEYSRVVNFMALNVNRRDRVYGDASGYYAAKQLGFDFYTTDYGGGRGYPNLLESPTFTVLLISPPDLKKVVKKVGGSWEPVSGTLSTCASNDTDIHHLARCYQITVYRRLEAGH